MSIRSLVPRFGSGRTQTPARREDIHPLADFQQEMNRLFDDFFNDFSLTPSWGDMGGLKDRFAPKVDVSETDKEVNVSVELPGMEEKDISVEMDDDMLTIRGERKEESEEKGKHWYRREQSYGSFHRAVPLPASVEGEKAKARFKKGVLKVTAPKKETEAKPRKTIAIESD